MPRGNTEILDRVRPSPAELTEITRATRFPAGEENPSAKAKAKRQRGPNLTEILQRKLLEEVKGKQGYVTKAELLVDVAIAAAAKGDFRYWKEIIDRTDGKVPDRLVAHEGDDERTVEFIATIRRIYRLDPAGPPPEADAIEVEARDVTVTEV